MPGVAALSYSSAPARVDLNTAVGDIENTLPGYVIGTWELFADGREADRVFLIKKGTGEWFKIHYDPFTNAIVDQPRPLNSQLTDWLVLLHYTIFGYQPDVNPLASNYATSVTFDKHTGAFLSAYQGPEAAILARLTDSFRQLHFGSFGGLAIKIVWSILGFTPCILALSGFYLWLKRHIRPKRRRRARLSHLNY